MGRIGCFVVGTLVGAGAVALLAVLAEEPLLGNSTSEPEDPEADVDKEEQANENIIEVIFLPETH